MDLELYSLLKWKFGPRQSYFIYSNPLLPGQGLPKISTWSMNGFVILGIVVTSQWFSVLRRPVISREMIRAEIL